MADLPDMALPVWGVGALCQALADALQARFNPVQVRGEISGFTQAASGHWYFSLKDAQGQIRCAMFRRAAQALEFTPREGELVQVQGRLDVYPQRGDLQLIVEGMQRVGQGALFEAFLRLKAKLAAQGLFDSARKRAIPPYPRGIAVVTSPGAAALQDVLTTLVRRVPHIPVLLVPALVQGIQAPQSLCEALSKLYLLAQAGQGLEAQNTKNTPQNPPIDVILLVRGGGSIEDLWAFNDAQLAHTIVQSPVPLISGVGHESDFTIADFCADLRAPTPTAAAELAAPAREMLGAALGQLGQRLGSGMQRQLDAQALALDRAAQHLGSPGQRLGQESLRLERLGQRVGHAMLLKVERLAQSQRALEAKIIQATDRRWLTEHNRLEGAALRLQLLDPDRLLQRGYARLMDTQGRSITAVRQVRQGDALRVQVADGCIDVTVAHPRLL